MFDAYEQEYTDKTYTLFTDNLNTEYRLFSQLQASMTPWLLTTTSLMVFKPKPPNWHLIFSNDRTGYDLKT